MTPATPLLLNFVFTYGIEHVSEHVSCPMSLLVSFSGIQLPVGNSIGGINFALSVKITFEI